MGWSIAYSSTIADSSGRRDGTLRGVAGELVVWETERRASRLSGSRRGDDVLRGIGAKVHRVAWRSMR